jgi:stearoyl-CoA desaturase (delta-9 desaturase)
MGTPLTNTTKWNYTNLFWISLVHLAILPAIFFFSWSGLAIALFGVFVLAPIGINVGYHRLLSHRSFSCPRWLRYSLVTVGAIIGAGPPMHWAAMHRLHHRFSDSGRDPHDSNKGFWYSHILHLFITDEAEENEDHLAVYAPDLLKEPYLVLLNKYWIWLAFATLPLLYLGGGISWVLWGGFMRLAGSWHIMWFVNSATHRWGYRNYESADQATNCWWVGLLAAGEGWHNNHHAHPSCAAHGHRWWELDVSFLFIRALEFTGLAHSVKRPAAWAKKPAT